MSKELNQTEKNDIEKILKQLAEITVKNSFYPNIGLLSGLMGETLFLYEYSQINPKYLETVEKNIDLIFESIENGNVYHTYCNGLSGICLGLEYILSRIDNDHQPFDFVSPEIDDWLTDKLVESLEAKNWDFLHGGVGIGFYFLKKFNLGFKSAEKQLDILLNFLNEYSVNHNGLTIWKTDKDRVNISLSHGMTSIVLFLLELYNSEFKSTINIENLIKESIQYILSQKIDPAIYNSYFPSTSLEENDNLVGSRLAWCYGDLGIALMLKKASLTFNNKVWNDKSNQILEYSTKRKNFSETLIVDAGICHGCSGVTLFFLKEYLLTNNNLYQDAYKFWLTKTIDYCNEDYEHFSKVFYNTLSKEYETNTNLLEGTSGLGLTLISCLNNQNLSWSEFFLI